MGSNHEKRGMGKGVRDKKRRRVWEKRCRKVNGVGKQDADQIEMDQQVGRKRGGRDDKAGLKSDLARQAHWDKPGMTEMPIAPKDMSSTGRPVHPRAFG